VGLLSRDVPLAPLTLVGTSCVLIPGFYLVRLSFSYLVISCHTSPQVDELDYSPHARWASGTR